MIEYKDLNVNDSGVVDKSKTISNKTTKKNIQKQNAFGIVKNGNLNLRSLPDLKSDILKVLKDASKVKILSEDNEIFYKVNADGIIGYCMKKFIKKVL